MKSTTIFLGALTVFSTIILESSTSPAPSIISGLFETAEKVLDTLLGDVPQEHKANCAIDEQICKIILQRIEMSDKCLADVNTAKKEVLANAGDANQEGLTEACAFLDSFNTLVPEIHGKLKKMCNGGSEADRVEVIAEMNAAIENTNTFLASAVMPADLKAVMDKGIGRCILTNAVDVSEMLQKENVVSDDLKQEISKRIQANADALEESKKCLAKATGDEQNQLTSAKDFLKALEELFLTIVKKIETFMNSKSLEGRDELVKEMLAASKDTKANLDGLETILEVKKCLAEYIEGIMIPNCDYVAGKLSEL